MAERQEVMTEVQILGIQVLHSVSWRKQKEVQASVVHPL